MSKRCEKIEKEKKKKRYYVNSKKKEKDRSDCRIKIHYDKTLIAERKLSETPCATSDFQSRTSSDLNNVTSTKRDEEKRGEILSKL